MPTKRGEEAQEGYGESDGKENQCRVEEEEEGGGCEETTYKEAEGKGGKCE
jgi:hypothetical protein